MKNILILSAALCILGTLSCSHLSSSNSEFIGEYQGVLPCADCEGIKTTLLFKEDYSFEKSTIYLGKEANFNTDKGQWSLLNDTTVALQEKSGEYYFHIKNNQQLTLVDKNTSKEKTELHQTLYKINREEPTEGNYNYAIKEGIDFYATGTEPFWSLKLYINKGLEFNQPDFEKPISIKDFKTEFRDNYTLVSPVAKSEIKEIRIYNMPCVDDMSGMVSNNFVEIVFKDKNLKGCGQALNPKLSLTGEWKLSNIKGIDLTKYKTEKNITIKFDLKQCTASGLLGCNTFSCSIDFKEDYSSPLQFGSIRKTKMSCPNIEVENKYTAYLSEADSYKIVNNELQLLKNNDLLLSFKR